jgi:serine/threonine-protein kinase
MDELTRLRTALADHYRLDREIGQGGMATVFIAEDLRHERKVAVKLLRPELSAILGAERFLNEIKVTAHLQHPHILPVYDSGAADGLLYYVMPYVEGESLRQLLQRDKQLAVDDAIEITRAVASALAYAHKHGVIHRDIKPENILLHEGQAIVADFGIALAVTNAGGSRLTQTGLSLGTPHYMSPEQATGDRAVDGRSDIYSLGCAAYEMLAGEPPHTGPTAQAIIAKIMTDNVPRLGLARPTVPRHIEAAIHKALEKLPADRWQSAAAFADALSRPSLAMSSALPAVGDHDAETASRSRRRATPVMVGIATLFGIALGLTAAFVVRPSSSASNAPLGRFSLPVGPVTALANPFSPELSISPDGSLIAFVGRGSQPYQLFIRAIGDSIPRAVAGTEGGGGPFFSPDGRQLGFWTVGRLMKVPLDGGVATEIADSAGWFAAWADNGSVLYTDILLRRLRMVEPDGTKRDIARTDTATFLTLSVLPGSKTALVVMLSGGRNRTALMAVSLRDGKMREVGLSNVAMAKYVPSGHIVFQPRVGGPLQAVPFDVRRLRVTGASKAIAPAARIGFRVIPHWDVSSNGSIVYVKPEPFQLVLTDRQGRTTTLRDDARSYHHPRLSPDGRRVALDITDPTARDVWIVDVGDHSMTRFTVGETANDPFWSPDGRRIAYTSTRGPIRGVFLRNVDGSGVPDSVLTDTHDRSSGSWTPDGKAIVSSTSRAAGLDIVTVAGQRGTAKPILGSRATEAYPAISPDGKWLAYVSDENGRLEVYVRAFPGSGGRRQISLDGGSEPVWTKGGRELVYREDGSAGSRLIAVALRPGASLDVLSRTPLFDVSDYVSSEDHANYDVTPDGNRFVMVRSPQSSAIQLIQNWPVGLNESRGRR